MKKILFLLPAILLALGIGALSTGCSTGATKQGHAMAERGQNIFTIETRSGMTKAEVSDVILKALANRGWTVTNQTDNEIQADLNLVEKRHVHGVLDITFTEALITINDHSTDEKGQLFVPIRWITHLTRDIRAGLNLPIQ